MIETVDLLELITNIGHVKYFFDRMPFDKIFKCINLKINVQNHLQSIVDKINSLWNYIKPYPINVIFNVANVLNKV